jgi:hypothetical protein
MYWKTLLILLWSIFHRYINLYVFFMELEILPRDFAEILYIYVVWWENEITLGPGPGKTPRSREITLHRSWAKVGPQYFKKIDYKRIQTEILNLIKKNR